MIDLRMLPSLLRACLAAVARCMYSTGRASSMHDHWLAGSVVVLVLKQLLVVIKTEKRKQAPTHIWQMVGIYYIWQLIIISIIKVLALTA